MPADGPAHSIFLSYSSKHRDLTRAFAETIEGQYGAGSVWWDHALESWGDYEFQIRNALHQARVVVVLWSASAAASEWVKSEAGRAHRDHKLVNVLIPGTSPRDVPGPFDQYHFKELHDTPGILRSIDAVWTGRPVRTAVPLHEIYFQHHGQRLIDPKQRTLPGNPRDIGPSELLQAPYEVVDYVDVSGVQTQFLEWCTQPGRATAGRLVHGPGGLGKTRLMVSLAAKLRSQGQSQSQRWTAGFLDRPRDTSEATLKQRWQALVQLIDQGDDAGLLIVIDYAEARQDEVRALAKHLCDRPETDTRPVRLVLLARSAGEWWTALHDDTPDIQRVFRSDDPASVMELPAVSSGALRRALFEASLKAFGPRLEAQGVTSPGGTPSDAYLTQIETAPGLSRPLAIQMAALVWLTYARPAAAATSVENLLRLVLGLERDHWRKLLGDLGEERRRDLERAVAQVAVIGGMSTSESAERLLMADEFYQGRRTARVDVDPVRRQLAVLYGGPNGGIVSLEPDLIAEHHVASVGDKELIDGCVRWVQSEPPDIQEQRRQYVLTVLQRATQAEHGRHVSCRAVALLEHLVEKHAVTYAGAIVAVIVNEPGALVSVLDRSVDRLAPEAVMAIAAVLPARSLALLHVSLKIAVRRLDLARHVLAVVSGEGKAGATEAQHDLAACLNVLSLRLSNLGRREEAFAASDEAVAICRRLAELRPAFLPHLATGLNNLGGLLSRLGRREEALAAGDEAVAIRRRLSETRPDDFLPDLARSLNNNGVWLSNLGRPEEAFAATQEAVEIYRRLLETRPDAFWADLAIGLNNLGNRLSNLGRREEALTAIEEAVAIHWKLAEVLPDAFLPALAFGLNNLGVRLSELGRREDAMVRSQEAVSIYRLLTAARLDVYLPNLAASLNNLGSDLADLGRCAEALAPSEEAVAIHRRLAEARPDAFLPNLAASLNNLGNQLSNLERREEAMAASQEAVAIRRRLVEARPDVFLPDLASTLNNLGDDLSKLGRGEEALAASQEAVSIYRRLAEVRRDAFLPILPASLSVLSEVLATLGRHAEAASLAHEALEILVPFVEREPAVFGALARLIVKDVLNFSEASSETPNIALVERITRALGDVNPCEPANSGHSVLAT